MEDVNRWSTLGNRTTRFPGGDGNSAGKTRDGSLDSGWVAGSDWDSSGGYKEVDVYARRIELVLDTAKVYVGTWYAWGGDDPSGFDCSGLMVEFLKIGGLLSRGEDLTAEGLRLRFEQYKTEDPQPGTMLFWGKMGAAVHVEMVIAKIGDQIFTIGASGGGSQVKTKQDAIAANAFVKIRVPKSGWMSAVHPWWAAAA